MGRFFLAVAFVVTLGACAPAPVREAARPPNPFRDAQQQALPATPPEREQRYYVDEQGVYWDDRGRKLAGPPGR